MTELSRRSRLLAWFIRWTVVLALLSGLLALLYALQGSLSERSGPDVGAAAQDERRAANNIVKLGTELAESFGLKEAAAQSVEWQPRVVAYGRVVPNPRAMAEVRAPFAGTLRAAANSPWPALGGHVEAGDTLGWLDIRVGPQERLDLEIKLREARAKQQGAEEVFKIQQERLQRIQSLESPGAIARADLDQALVQLADARTQLVTARAAVQQWQDALTEINGSGERKETAWTQPLKAPAAGEITDLAGRPGMALEAGGVVARLVDFRRALVRLDIPVRILTEGPPPEVELVPVAESPPSLAGATNRSEPAAAEQPARAVFAGIAPQVEPSSQYAGYWYEVDNAQVSVLRALNGSARKTHADRGGAIWRPGLFVQATVKIPESKPRKAVAVPERALLYHQGRALVYVRITPGRFERREVQVLGRDADRWVLASGVAPGELVISERAQALLSEEFRTAADVD
ncbi:MAG TPA: hypothetical protein VKU02_20840 [Gemmataceae bacterium]|nr:hypothetical protein [Gemmataceae bacterium]